MIKIIDFLIYKHLLTLLCVSPLLGPLETNQIAQEGITGLTLYFLLWMIFIRYVYLVRARAKKLKTLYYLLCFFTVYFVGGIHDLSLYHALPDTQVNKHDLMFCILNAIESAFWFTCSCIFAYMKILKRKNNEYNMILMATSAFFLSFSISDILEIFTGAWWQPMSLLYLKALSVWGLYTCYFRYLKKRKEIGGSSSIEPAGSSIKVPVK